jgi:hypothetical protein
MTEYYVLHNKKMHAIHWEAYQQISPEKKKVYFFTQDDD